MSSGDLLRDSIAQVVCRKAPDTPFPECFARKSEGRSPCHDRDKCRIAEKTEEQLSYVAHDITVNSFLRACPGSGKTEVVGLMAAYHIARRDVAPGGLAVLTFTRNAAGEIAERVSQYARVSTVPYPHFVGTIDSWLHKYIVQPFGWMVTGYKGDGRDRTVTLVDSDCRARFLDAFVTRNGLARTGHVRANEYFFDCEQERYEFRSGDRWRDDQRNAAPTEPRIREDLQRTKERFWASGYATYEDMENIAHELVTGNEQLRKLLRRRFPCIVIDECQDLSWVQLGILESLLRDGANVHLVGDLNQAIYGFRKVYPERVRTFAEERRLARFSLSRNFRSVQPIVDLCVRLIPSDRPIQGEKYDDRLPSCGYTCFEKHEVHELVSRFERYLKQRGYDPEKCAVLTRARATVARLRPCPGQMSGNNAECLAKAIHVWQRGGRQAMDEALSLAGRFLAATCFEVATDGERYHYCPLTEKSHMQWRLCLSRFLSKLCEIKGISDLEQSWGTWAANVRRELAAVLAEVGQGTTTLIPNRRSVVAPRDLGDERVIDTLDSSTTAVPSMLRVTTIHQAKGETFDAVLLVSAPARNSEGGHWSQWIGHTSGHDEYVRFGYVACSRPKKLLVWAVPKISRQEAETLEELGLTRIDM